MQNGAVVKSVITPACHAGGRGFKSLPLRHFLRTSFRGCPLFVWHVHLTVDGTACPIARCGVEGAYAFADRTRRNGCGFPAFAGATVFLNTASFPRGSPKEWALPFPSRGVAPERGFPCRKATAPLRAAACRFISCTGSGFSSHEGRVLPPSFDPVESYSFSARWAGCSPPEPSRKISPAAHTVMAFAAWSGSSGPIFLRGHRSERSANRRNRSARSAHTEETL